MNELTCGKQKKKKKEQSVYSIKANIKSDFTWNKATKRRLAARRSRRLRCSTFRVLLRRPVNCRFRAGPRCTGYLARASFVVADVTNGSPDRDGAAEEIQTAPSLARETEPSFDDTPLSLSFSLLITRDLTPLINCAFVFSSFRPRVRPSCRMVNDVNKRRGNFLFFFFFFLRIVLAVT